MPFCRQPNHAETEEIGEEDCLYLNVFTNSVLKLLEVETYVHKIYISNNNYRLIVVH